MEKDFDVTPPIDTLAKAIDRLESEGQLIRPVANVLRKAADIQAPGGEPFSIGYEMLAVATKDLLPFELSLDIARKKDSRAKLIAHLENAFRQILALKAETDDVRRIAEHYRGLVAAHEMSAGAIHLLEVKTRENDMKRCRELIGKHFHLNETETDNLGNQGNDMVDRLLGRFSCFADEVRRAMFLLDFVLEACEDDGFVKTETLKTLRALFNMALHNKGEYRIE